jgi:Tfp pilus assembly protein FimT
MVSRETVPWFYRLSEMNKKLLHNQSGIGIVEVVIVMLVIAILVVLALPQIMSSRRLMRFSGMQKSVVAELRDARQEAMTERQPVTFRYDDATKTVIIYGGQFGAAGAGANKIVTLTDSGLSTGELIYGRPPGALVSALADGSNMTALSSNVVDITFQADGSVVDAGGNPINKALFFYDNKNANGTAFAVSILGAGGRAKMWRFSQGVNSYVE